MFAGCNNLKGSIPSDIFYTYSPEGTEMYYNSLTDISGMFSDCYGLGFSYGLLNSTTPAIRGGNNSNIYGDAEYKDDGKQVQYLVPVNWLSKCINLTDISYLFNNIAPNTDWLTPEIVEPSYVIIKDDLILLNDLFSSHTQINNAEQAFTDISVLTGTLDNNFLSKSLKTLTNVCKIFAYCTKLNSVGNSENYAIFQYPQLLGGSSTKNTVLKNISYAFYGCENLTGYGPRINELFKCSNSANAVFKCNGLNNFSSYNATQTAEDYNYQRTYGGTFDIKNNAINLK
jgi:hypothetical protein